MDHAEISVVMPVYNAEEYLREALDCVLDQDFTAYKLYCVDDASGDGSYEILQEYEKKDERIQVFRNERRMGAAYSRNFILKMIDTKYVKFADADDLMERNLFSQLYDAATKFHADIAYCEWSVFEGDVGNGIIFSRYPESEQEREQERNPHQLKDLPLENALKITNAPWAFLMKMAFLKEENLQFQSLSTRNDVYFLEMAKMLAKKMVHTSSFQPLVHQREHRSASRIANNPQPMNLFYAYLEVKKGMERKGIWEKYERYFIVQGLRLMRYQIASVIRPQQREPFLKFLRKEGLKQLGICKEALTGRNHVSDDIFYLYECMQNGTATDFSIPRRAFREVLLENCERIRELFSSWKGKK